MTKQKYFKMTKVCPQCKEKFIWGRDAQLQRASTTKAGKIKHAGSGPFCSKGCAGVYFLRMNGL